MLEAFVTKDKKLVTSKLAEKNNWIALTKPTYEELNQVSKATGALIDLLEAPLDPEESSRIEVEDDQVLIIVNASIEISNNTKTYVTIPLGILVLKDHIVTITLEELDCLEHFKTLGSSLIESEKKTRFTLQIIYKMSEKYLKDLKRIDWKTEQIENDLYRSLENEMLIELLNLEKTLVYFRTSLRANKQVMKKLFRATYLRRYEEDEYLLEDVIIELEQAIEMADINSSIISSMRDGFASIMSNNLNNTMKTLASLTIILTIPTMIFSFFGMNVYLGGEFVMSTPVIPFIIILITILLTIIIFRMMKKRSLF